MNMPVVKAVTYVLAHTPHLVRYGSKPSREVAKEPELIHEIEGALRSYDAARDYGPHQVYIGNRRPEDLAEAATPWYANQTPGERMGPFGEIIPEIEFYALMRIADTFSLLRLEESASLEARQLLQEHPQRAKIAVLLQQHDVAGVYEGVEKRSDGPARAVGQKDGVNVNLSAALLLQVLGDNLPHTEVSLRGRVACETFGLAHQRSASSLGVGFAVYRDRAGVSYREHILYVRLQPRRRINLSGQILREQIRIVHCFLP